jgi:methanethiol S-methyltransferase
VKVLAVVCYLVALAGVAALGGFVLLLGCGLLSPPARLPGALACLADSAWLAGFTAQHSGMARESFKRRWARVVSARLERSVYAALSGVLLLALPFVWQPLPGGAWWELPRVFVLVPLFAAAGLVLVNLRYDHAGLFGLRQAWEGAWPEEDKLLITGPYRYVRHPLMACVLVFLWAQPVMTSTLALLCGGLTGYIALGLTLEERDLLCRFGKAYAGYRRRVPALVPWRRPAPPATHPACLPCDPGQP